MTVNARGLPDLRRKNKTSLDRLSKDFQIVCCTVKVVFFLYGAIFYQFRETLFYCQLDL